MKNILLSITLFSALFAAGCGVSTPGSSSVSCEANPGMTGHICTGYTGAGVTSSSCGAAKSVSSCPTANAVGTCTNSVSIAGISESTAVTYYSDGGFTAMTAQMSCTQGG